MLLFTLLTIAFQLGVWLGYYVGSHREEES